MGSSMSSYYNDHLSPEENEAVRRQKLQEDLSCPPLPLREAHYGSQAVTPPGFWDKEESEPEDEHEIHVGNIGLVHAGSDEAEAEKHFKNYVDQSKSGKGRAGGEAVTWMKNGDVHQEHGGELEEGEDEYEDDDERWHPTDDMPDDEPEGPEEGDYTTEDHVNFYQDGKKVLTVPGGTDGDHVKALNDHMEKNQFWPNAWHISDHGNAHLIDLSGKPSGPQGGKTVSPAKVKEGDGDDYSSSFKSGYDAGYNGEEPTAGESRYFFTGHREGKKDREEGKRHRWKGDVLPVPGENIEESDDEVGDAERRSAFMRRYSKAPKWQPGGKGDDEGKDEIPLGGPDPDDDSLLDLKSLGRPQG